MPDTKAAHTMMIAATMKAPMHATTERAGERRLRRRDACSTAQVEEKAASAAPMHPRAMASHVSHAEEASAPTISPLSSIPPETLPSKGIMSGVAASEDATSSVPPITPMVACAVS